MSARDRSARRHDAAASGAARARRDWTQWRGPNRDGAAPAPSDPKAWPEQLTQKWKVEVGSGYATPLVVGNRIYQFSRQGEREVMSALDADTGKVLWQTGHDAPFTMHSATTQHGPGPKSTPAFANGRLYSIGMTGIVTAYDANTGKQLWQKPGSTPVPMYTTHAFSPLVDRGLVIFHVGGDNDGALTAYDVNTGEEKWSWKGDGPGIRIADRGGHRRHASDHHDHAGEAGRRGCGERHAALGAAVRHHQHDQLGDARGARADGHRVGQRRADDVRWRSPSERISGSPTSCGRTPTSRCA